MPPGRPSRYVSGLPAERIERALLWREVHRLPMGVVEVRLRPQRLSGLRVDGRIADGELPWTVERRGGLAQGDLNGSRRRRTLGVQGGTHQREETNEEQANRSCHDLTPGNEEIGQWQQYTVPRPTRDRSVL